MIVAKSHCIHFQNHKSFVDSVLDMDMHIRQSQLLKRKFGDPIYIITVEGTNKQHKELANRIFNTLSSEEVILARERNAIWRSFLSDSLV